MPPDEIRLRVGRLIDQGREVLTYGHCKNTSPTGHCRGHVLIGLTLGGRAVEHPSSLECRP